MASDSTSVSPSLASAAPFVVDLSGLGSRRMPPPAFHAQRIRDEMTGPEPKDGMMRVILRMGAQAKPDLRDLDWDAELSRFDEIPYPPWYRQPFHSIPGGYLSEAAALGDRAALEAIYEEAHPRKSLGLRDAIAELVPDDARRVIDLGSGTGDGPAAIARRLPNAEVTAVELSPFMVTVGRRQNAGAANLELRHGFAERTGLPDACADVVNVTLLLHECPDVSKRKVLREAMRLLRRGGVILLSDTAQDSLDTFRGFHEPYREQWRRFDPDAFLREAGFTGVEAVAPAAPLWTRVARKAG